jgi:hypothetical protein
MYEMTKQKVHTEPEYLDLIDDEIGSYHIAFFIRQEDGTYKKTFKLGEDPVGDEELERANSVAAHFNSIEWYFGEALHFEKRRGEQALFAVQTMLGHKTKKTIRQLKPNRGQVTVPVLWDRVGNPTCKTPQQRCPFFSSGSDNRVGKCIHASDYRTGVVLDYLPQKNEMGKLWSYHPHDDCPFHRDKGSVTQQMKTLYNVVSRIEANKKMEK